MKTRTTHLEACAPCGGTGHLLSDRPRHPFNMLVAPVLRTCLHCSGRGFVRARIDDVISRAVTETIEGAGGGPGRRR